MNTFYQKAFVWIGSTMLCMSTQVFAGAEGRGGGDLKCDAKIRSIVGDSNASGSISYWISRNGPEVGKLNLSSSVYPHMNRHYTLAEYESAMAALFKLPLDSSCVSQGDPGYPVKIGDDSKVCVSSVSDGKLHMKCDQVKLLSMNADEQIEQVHHEYAINVPGLEPDYGPISTYKISLQLSAYTQDVVEKRLVVMAPAPPTNTVPGLYEKLRDLFNSSTTPYPVEQNLVTSKTGQSIFASCTSVRADEVPQKQGGYVFYRYRVTLAWPPQYKYGILLVNTPDATYYRLLDDYFDTNGRFINIDSLSTGQIALYNQNCLGDGMTNEFANASNGLSEDGKSYFVTSGSCQNNKTWRVDFRQVGPNMIGAYTYTDPGTSAVSYRYDYCWKAGHSDLN